MTFGTGFADGPIILFLEYDDEGFEGFVHHMLRNN
jgi:hypothetical protein